MQQATVVLGLEDPALQEEVLHFLDRLPGIRVAGAAADGDSLAAVIAERHPHVAVVSPGVVSTLSEANGAALLVVAERETTAGLRSALGAGARGFYLWPAERDALAHEARRAGTRPDPSLGPPGWVVAVYGARGGAGSTFVATNLAAACAARGAPTVLADVDTFFGDVTSAIGVPPTTPVPTVADLVPVLDELTPSHLDRVLYDHPRGFRALLAPADPAVGAAIPADFVMPAVETLRRMFEVVILDVPRSIAAGSRDALESADEILLVVALDVLAFRDAGRVLSYLAEFGLAGRCRLVVNRATGGEVVPQDVERVFRLRPLAIMRQDRAVARAMNRGELLPERSGQVGRCLAGLARHVVEGARADRRVGASPGPASEAAS